MVEALQAKHIRDITCGSNQSAAITSNGELYTWGSGEDGCLGHGDKANQLRPKQVRKKSAYQFLESSLGSRITRLSGHLYGLRQPKCPHVSGH